MNTNTRGRIAAALLAGALAAFAGCASGPEIRAEYDKSVDFASYKTFAYVSPLGTDRNGYQSIVSQHLKAAAKRELEARGMTYSEKSPQLLVNFNARLSDKMRVDTYSAPMMAGPYYGYRGGYYGAWPMYGAETHVTNYTEGTLNIDVIDAARRQLVWEGVVVGTVTQKTLDNVQLAIDKAVNAAFAKYPVAGPAPAK